MGFAPQWLALREAADRAARDDALLAAAARLAGAAPVVVDLGAGTGATVRALTGHLPDTARWHLVDNDAALLALAVANHPNAQACQLDLNRLADLPLDDTTLVSASALLDLVSERWLRALIDILVRHQLPFYAALSYDGVMQWQPELADDADITAAFNRDQCTDKGFGPALGAASGIMAKTLFEQAGYHVMLAQTPWVLTHRHAQLQADLLDGIAGAAARAGHGAAHVWNAARQALVSQGTCTIGHVDILAVPTGRVALLDGHGGADG